MIHMAIFFSPPDFPKPGLKTCPGQPGNAV